MHPSQSIPAPRNIVSQLTVVPGLTLPAGSFSDSVKLLKRPYISLSIRQFQRIQADTHKAHSEIVIYQGKQYTFGNADDGFALMPLIHEV